LGLIEPTSYVPCVKKVAAERKIDVKRKYIFVLHLKKGFI